MKRVLSAVSLGVAALCSAAIGPAHAQSVQASQAENGTLWFVELSGAPTADGGSLATVQSEKAAFRKAAKAAGVRFTERRAYDALFNGFAVEVADGERGKLLRLPGVKALYPVERIAAPTVERFDAGSVADMATAIAMTGADRARNELGLTGKGVRVAIIDSGIDIDHPDFGGQGTNGSTSFPTTRIVKGYDFVGDAFNADPASAAYNPEAKPDNNPDDCGGHGTHVAGIVGANGTVKGVAPEVTLGAYRVFGCAGSTTSDIMLAAMERVLADGMHVVNMSIGASFQWPDYPTAKAADRLVNKGVSVIASIGNSGANGLYAAGAPGVGAKVIGVANFENTHVTLPTFTVSPDGTPIGYTSATAAPLPPSVGTANLSRTGNPTVANDGCTPLTAGSLANTVVLIRRGTCGFYDKALNAQNAGAAGVILYNNTAGRINPTVAGAVPITIPVVAVSDAEGVLLNNRIAAGSATITWRNQLGQFVNTGVGGLISSTSSYGLAADLSLKPNIGGPGGNIFSTYPLEQGAFATLSGTSMSSPHVAGGVALMLQAKPNTPSNGVKARLQNAADPKNWSGNASLGYLDHVHRQGAGMLDIVGSIKLATVVEPSELSLGESQSGPVTRTLTLKNSTGGAITYTLGHTGALSTGQNTFTPAAALGFAAVTFSAPTVTVPANGTATVNVTIAANAGLAERSLYGGYITLTPQEGDVVRVPYAGMKGDYQSVTVLTPAANGFPWLARLNAGQYLRSTGTDVFTLAGGDLPYFLMHLDHHASRVRLEAFDLNGANLGRVSDDRYVARNSTATGFFTWTWDGTVFDGKAKNASQVRSVPNGQYVVKVSVLKPLGDENNAAHWETWTSPTITIARP